jgi:hypothetical protein
VHDGTTKKEAAWANLSEIPNQIRAIRTNNKAQGSIFFSSKSLSTVAKAVADSLKNDLYKYPALPPKMPWLDDVMPYAPNQLTAIAQNEGVNLKWAKPFKAKDGETASGYVVYRFEEGENTTTLHAKNILKISFHELTSYLDTTAKKGKTYQYLVTALDRLKNESEASQVISVNTN